METNFEMEILTQTLLSQLNRNRRTFDVSTFKHEYFPSYFNWSKRNVNEQTDEIKECQR